MQHFYDGQIRRYITQTIRILSNFVVKYGDGTLHQIPVMYGDSDRQVASILRNNSENKINSVPRISVYVSALSLDRERLSDSTFVSKVHIRERELVNDTYTSGQGKNYTVERLMPTPFKLVMKVDIWSANTDQKLQILEQMLVLFNPSLELQTTDNFIDWTSLSVLNLNDITWSSKTVPVGVDTPIDVATFTLDTPIWISPPVKVKHLGVITKIISNLWENGGGGPANYIDGLGVDTSVPTTSFSAMMGESVTTITDFNIEVYGGVAALLGPSENVVPVEPTIEVPVRQGSPINWDDLFSRYPGQFINGSSRIFLIQADGTEVVGTAALDPMTPTNLVINWDPYTYPTDTLIDSNGIHIHEPGFDQSSARGNVDAIINPQKVYPGHGMTDVQAGDRFLIIEDIGANINVDGPDGWKSTSGVDFVAKANDIIEWDGTQWIVVFNAAQEYSRMTWQTNIYNSTKPIQYVWNGAMWAKSFEGEYKAGQWRLEL